MKTDVGEPAVLSEWLDALREKQAASITYSLGRLAGATQSARSSSLWAGGIATVLLAVAGFCWWFDSGLSWKGPMILAGVAFGFLLHHDRRYHDLHTAEEKVVSIATDAGFEVGWKNDAYSVAALSLVPQTRAPMHERDTAQVPREAQEEARQFVWSPGSVEWAVSLSGPPESHFTYEWYRGLLAARIQRLVDGETAESAKHHLAKIARKEIWLPLDDLSRVGEFLTENSSWFDEICPFPREGVCPENMRHDAELATYLAANDSVESFINRLPM